MGNLSLVDAGVPVRIAEMAPDALRARIANLHEELLFCETDQGLTLTAEYPGRGYRHSTPDGFPVRAYLPATPLTNLGDPAFCQDHGIRYAYVTGAMANGIASVDIVEAMSRAGMLGIFGAAGLSLEKIDQAITRLQSSLGSRPYGVNLIHSPNEPDHENATVDLLLRRKVHLIEASAYLDLTPAVVRYRVTGIHRGADGVIRTPNRIIAKVSRVEVATKFMSPPSDRLLQTLVQLGQITREEAELARQIPMADDLTAEADSGGHTDNRPAITLLPTMIALRDHLHRKYGYPRKIRVGAAGGISTPASVAAALAMGSAYLVTGSINQACVESGSSDRVRAMLAEAGQADITMAPAADMFEMGVKVQVLKRGTMFAMRANKLYELYRTHGAWSEVSPVERKNVEQNILRAPFEQIWAETRSFFERRDPQQISRAERDPKHQMALVFRWYLGLSSRWANAGDPSRVMDYQVWCGPAMGAFNEWVRGTFLEKPESRSVVTLARNLLYGGAVALRQLQLNLQGIHLPTEVFAFSPLTPAELDERLKEAG